MHLAALSCATFVPPAVYIQRRRHTDLKLGFLNFIRHGGIIPDLSRHALSPFVAVVQEQTSNARSFVS